MRDSLLVRPSAAHGFSEPPSSSELSSTATQSISRAVSPGSWSSPSSTARTFEMSFSAMSLSGPWRSSSMMPRLSAPVFPKPVLSRLLQEGRLLPGRRLRGHDALRCSRMHHVSLRSSKSHIRTAALPTRVAHAQARPRVQRIPATDMVTRTRPQESRKLAPELVAGLILGVSTTRCAWSAVPARFGARPWHLRSLKAETAVRIRSGVQVDTQLVASTMSGLPCYQDPMGALRGQDSSTLFARSHPSAARLGRVRPGSTKSNGAHRPRTNAQTHEHHQGALRDRVSVWIRGLSQAALSSRAPAHSRVAHICARSEGGPRWAPQMSEEANRSGGNLILMCLEHATEIDETPEHFPVESSCAPGNMCSFPSARRYRGPGS
jgi:hypothetical protein